LSPQEHQLGQNPATAEPLVVICILNWNGWRDTIKCVESIRALLYPNYLAVVVENGSLNESLEKLRAWGKDHLSERAFVEYGRGQAVAGGDATSEACLAKFPSSQRMVLINTQENLGFNGGCNAVFRYALMRPEPAEYVFLLNNDAIVAPDCLSHIVATDHRCQAGIVGTVIGDPENGEIASGGNRGNFPLLREFFWPLITWKMAFPDREKEFEHFFYAFGTARAMRKNVLEALYNSDGYYFDEAAFIYGDEIDVGERARKKGFMTVIANRALVYHRRGSSSGGLYNPIVNYYPTRNRIREARAILPWYLLPAFHTLHISWNAARALNNLRRGRRQSALAILRGLIDGYRGVTGKWSRHDEEVLVWAEGKKSINHSGARTR